SRRRRHTRFSRDWSSDVCSSDLGKYAVCVGSLTVPLHNAWADAAIAYLKEKYPQMELVGDRYGVAEDVDASRKTALDLISAHPEIGRASCRERMDGQAVSRALRN